jgi:tripartite-type tricarboxylate transporter receptor subunit TctC
MSGLSRRAFNAGLTAAAGAALLPGTAGAQSFATKDLEFVCAFAPGSGADVIVRFFADKMRPMLGKNVITVNKVGALGNIATEYVARSKPDGHTVYLMSAGVLAANTHILKTQTVDVLKELQIFGTMFYSPYMIAVSAKSPHKSIADLTAALKAKGDKASYGFSNGGAVKVVASLYKQKADLTKMEEVTYRSSQECFNDLDSGQLDFGVFESVFSISEQKKGTMRILAVSTPERLKSAPDFPTMTELGYPMNVIGWWAGFVPSATPRPIVDQLGKMLSDVVASEDGRKFLTSIATDPWIQSPDQGQAFMKKDIEAWGEFVKIAKIEKV